MAEKPTTTIDDIVFQGDGTEEYPWEFHSYQELVVLTSDSSFIGSRRNYIKLMNDINCNDYSDSFEWKTINLGHRTTYNWNDSWDVNLNGHTIKNIMIAANNYLFYQHGSNACSQLIHDGKILNVYNNSAKAILYWGISLDKVSMSVNGTNLSDIAFYMYNAKMQNSAIYYKSTKLNNLLFYYNDESANPIFLNCDFYLDIDDNNSQKLFGHAYNSGTAKHSGCRLRGGIANTTITSNMLGDGAWSDSVIDFSVKSGGNISLYNNAKNATGVINMDKLEGNISVGDNILKATTEQIKDAKWLNDNGFSVVKVD